MSLTKSTLNNNNALWDGGAIYNDYSNSTINNSILNYNKADIDGGAIYNVYSYSTINNSILNNNKVNGSGSAIYNDHTNLNIKNTEFNKNNANSSGGAIYCSYSDLTITNSTLNNNKATRDGGAICSFWDGNLTINNCTLDNNKAGEDGGAICNIGNLTMINSTLSNNNANDSGGAICNYRNATIKVNTFTTNTANITGKAIINTTETIISNNTNADISKYSGTIYTSGTNVIIINNIFDDRITYTKTTIQTVKGVIGEKLTLKATVTDTNNNKVNEGNLIFKLNGITIKDNGKLTGSSNPLKVKVTNGVATATITPDLDMRNADKLTAHYIGTNNYNASASGIAKIQISQRNASIIVSSNVKIIKQGQVLTITAKVYDTTNGKQSTNLTVYNDQFVYFKVNGITLKDSKGNMLKVKVVNGMATINYTIPLGLSCVTDGKSMTPKNHTILAGFYNKNYQENIRNTSYFQVERSNITITISNVTVNNKTHKLSLTATIRDYLGNIVKGPNKCVIKVNGISLKNGTEAMYYYSTDGILNIRNIDISSYSNYKTIEIVTQDRLAYKSQRKTTSTIKIVNK